MNSSNNKFFEVLEYILDLIILNFLFIICSLPLFTIFPAYAALVGSVKMTAEEEPIPAWKSYFILFSKYSRKGIKIWLILLSISILIIGDVIATFYFPNELQNFFLPFIVVVILLFFCIYTYITKLLILGEYNIKRIFASSFRLVIKNPIKLMIIIVINSTIIIFSVYLKFLPFLMTFSLLAFTQYFIMFAEDKRLKSN
ncbi:DUF624 domain-containing protein [Ferdinandcohnia quinoae]|uniref:DUF624 domain-containing protein n=1 Tax=Fredinandcohnia quinoae TaxID=2918902 RepID=A0AAW5DV46_9BACI|nr:DUF624 domain-containing protein [Fredinandcohnia sp. SECRCQ15]MCH1624511.1 DUF624 domain-containing protein [Fredinandcohnia sp. SECRCQ15]